MKKEKSLHDVLFDAHKDMLAMAFVVAFKDVILSYFHISDEDRRENGSEILDQIAGTMIERGEE